MILTSVRELLRDRRRSQQGSVLSGVLLITAFVAILSGALMSAVSTNFLLSRTLVNRVNNQATVNSAMEQALSQLAGASIFNGCPSLPAVTVNGVTAAAAYSSCAATFDPNTTPAFQQSASSPAGADGSIATLGGAGTYLAGDTQGNFYQYALGATTPAWQVSIGGSVSGPPMAMPDGTTVLVPVTSPTASASPACGAAGSCVGVLDYTEPAVECYLSAGAAVTSRPAAGVNFGTVAFFGDQAGDVYAYDTYGATCTFQASTTSPAPVVAGPVVYRGQVSNQQSSDEVYFLASNGSASWLVHDTYTVTKRGAVSLRQTASLGLPAPQAIGFAPDQAQLPVRMAITFAGGTINLSTISTSFAMTSSSTVAVSGGIVAAPAWCCGSTPTQIAVPRAHSLSEFNSSLQLQANYSLGGITVSSRPVSDGGGDWFFGAADGNMYEVPALAGAPPLMAFGLGQFGTVQSVQVGACRNGWVCAYVASATNSASYTVQLDARSAVLTACISKAPPACSGSNPRLWASVQVGAFGSAQTVHVQGWSYYSP